MSLTTSDHTFGDYTPPAPHERPAVSPRLLTRTVPIGVALGLVLWAALFGLGYLAAYLRFP